MIRALFWTAAASLVYSFALFPALTFVRARLWPKPHRVADITPSVSIVIAARNEAAVIGAKVENLRALDYPVDRRQIVIASDGSHDGTPDIVRGSADHEVGLLDLPRVGKAAALEAAVAASTGEILVFSDANSMLRPDAIAHLVRPFADPDVGGVAGNQVYAGASTTDADSTNATAIGERSYWDLDRQLKIAQSQAGNAIAGTGAIYAIRRELFRPIPPGVTDDFYLTLCVIDAGFRLVFEPAAVAVEHVAASRSREYGRKVRIMTRGLRCVAVMRQLLDPRRTGFYALQLFSHKVLMRTTAIPLIVVALTTIPLAPRSWFYLLAGVGQAAFYGLALAGTMLAERPAGRRPFLSLPAYFCLVQAASLQATWNLLRGYQFERWEPSREPPPEPSIGASSPASLPPMHEAVPEAPRAELDR
jgi:cellulose synthase/poly-beta-1,6-N-acetylglucosamine synthase-like glycosyltransferase